MQSSANQSEDLEEISFTGAECKSTPDTYEHEQQKAPSPSSQPPPANTKRPKSSSSSNVNHFKRRKSENTTIYSQNEMSAEELEDEAEYIEIDDPKSEPIEYVSENENSTAKEDSFMQHLLEDPKNSFSSITATIPQDGNGSEQGTFYYQLFVAILVVVAFSCFLY